MKLSITDLSKNGPRTQVPTRPGECGISVHVFGIKPRTRIQKHLYGCFRAEGCRAVQGCFPFGPAITHEVIRCHRWLGRAIRIRTMGKEHLDHGVMSLAIGGAQGCVQRRFAGFGSRPVYVRTLLDQKLT
jgi:hypothetical protein